MNQRHLPRLPAAGVAEADRDPDLFQPDAIVEALPGGGPVLDEYGRIPMRHGAEFFNSFRDLTASGFWSSKMGIEDIGYVGNQPATWTGPPAEVLRKLGLEP